jgi:hypothetical protein
MPLSRRTFLFTAGMLGLAAACASPPSRLKTVRSPTGAGGVQLEVFNGTDAAINNLFMAKTEVVDAAGPGHLEPGSQQELKVWGADLLDRGALEAGGTTRVPVLEPGRWDVRVLDRDGRHQHVAGLKLGAGGQYVLELGDGGWRVR